MLKTVRRIALCLPLLAVLAVMAPAASCGPTIRPTCRTTTRTGRSLNDPNPPDPGLDYNTYWQEVQAKEQSGPGQ